MRKLWHREVEQFAQIVSECGEFQLRPSPFQSLAPSNTASCHDQNHLEGPATLKIAPNQAGEKPETVVPALPIGSTDSYLGAALWNEVIMG